MGASTKQMDRRMLELTQKYIEHLNGSRVEPEVRQTVWLWDFYHSGKNLLTYNRTKKLKNVESHSA
jgi:hypothetical protein